MNIFKCFFKKKRNEIISPLPTLEEAAEKLYGQNGTFEDYEIVKTIYSKDITKRFHILKSVKGFYKYTYEEIYIYDADEWSYVCNIDDRYPAFWMPYDDSCAYSFYGTQDEALSGVISQAEYKMYFE